MLNTQGNISRITKKNIEYYLQLFPIVLISGARKVGKSTLAFELKIPTYVTLNDINIYEMAIDNPRDFIESLKKPVVIDEIQRLPQLLIFIKEYLDRSEKNGEFLLVGSANLKGFKDVFEPLSEKIAIVELYPFSLKEKKRKDENVIDIFENDLDKLILRQYLHDDIAENIIDGGYPQVLKINSLKEKYLWFSSYIRTYIESDAKEFADIRNMDQFIKMYKLCMLRSSKPLNKNEIQKKLALDDKTFDNYFNVLEHTYQISKLQPYYNNNLEIVTKTPKIFATDTGVLSALLQNSSSFKDEIFRTFVYTELLKANAYSNKKVNIYYYKTSNGKEIDFILEFENRFIAIEVKAVNDVTKNDFKNMYILDKLKTFYKGIIIYNGNYLLKLDEKMYAVPIAIFD